MGGSHSRFVRAESMGLWEADGPICRKAREGTRARPPGERQPGLAMEPWAKLSGPSDLEVATHGGGNDFEDVRGQSEWRNSL